MPVYEYECSTCGAKIDRQLKMDELGNPQTCDAVVSACDIHFGHREDECLTCRISRECCGTLVKVMPSAQKVKADMRFTPGFVMKNGKKVHTQKVRGLGDAWKA